MNILIHARLKDVFDSVKASLENSMHVVDGAFSVAEGRRLMTEGVYDKVFIGIGVPLHDRLTLIACAGELGISMAEIIDIDTVQKELLLYSPSGKHPVLPPAAATES